MPIQLYLSGGTGNTNPYASLGGKRSSTQVTNDALENIFDDISRQEALVGKTEYRCLYVYNPSGNALTNVKVHISQHPTITNISIGSDAAGIGNGTSTAIASSIATEDTVPTGVTFYGESEDHYGLALGTLKAGEGTPFWLKREAETSTSQTISFTLTITEDSGTLPSTSHADGLALSEWRDFDTTPTGTYKTGTAKVGFSDIG
tara:strand:+ start:20732 stop:21343 length:612 start_codon:yes stop_codon:yes gene_type:complete